MPRSAVVLLRQCGHDALDVRDIGMCHAADYAGIVVIEMPDDATAPQVLKVLEAFLQREDWLARLPGRLVIVESWRVRFRPA